MRLKVTEEEVGAAVTYFIRRLGSINSRLCSCNFFQTGSMSRRSQFAKFILLISSELFINNDRSFESKPIKRYLNLIIVILLKHRWRSFNSRYYYLVIWVAATFFQDSMPWPSLYQLLYRNAYFSFLPSQDRLLG